MGGHEEFTLRTQLACEAAGIALRAGFVEAEHPRVQSGKRGGQFTKKPPAGGGTVGGMPRGTGRSFTYSYETYGPNGGYVTKTREVTGPFYHGRPTLHERGELLRPGSRHNTWGDEFTESGRSVASYFATEPDTAASYAQASGGYLYEVEPTGAAKWDSRGGAGSFQTRAPLRVLRRIPQSEWGRLPAGSERDITPRERARR